ncbi:hypothetical protein AA15973_1767 [Komagataeibacter sucrofermentans DSM 15973]|nr:hypothetical protein AA15973_1767 [Komagataeibacter sucrofermentans DSM 15973]
MRAHGAGVDTTGAFAALRHGLPKLTEPPQQRRTLGFIKVKHCCMEGILPDLHGQTLLFRRGQRVVALSHVG